MKLKQIAIATAAALSLGTAFAADTTSPSSTGYSSQDPSASIGSQSQSGTMSTQDKDLVRQVQQNLQSKGYNPGPIDGQFGNRTQAALKKFQKSQGSQASGSLDSSTLVALGVSQGGDTSSSSSLGSGASSSTTGSDTSTSNSATGSSSMTPSTSSSTSSMTPSTSSSSTTPSTSSSSSTPSTGSSSVNSTGSTTSSSSSPSSSPDTSSSTSGSSPSRY